MTQKEKLEEATMAMLQRKDTIELDIIEDYRTNLIKFIKFYAKEDDISSFVDMLLKVVDKEKIVILSKDCEKQYNARKNQKRK